MPTMVSTMGATGTGKSGMLIVGAGKKPISLEKLDEVIYRCVPSGGQIPHPYMEQADLS